MIVEISGKVIDHKIEKDNCYIEVRTPGGIGYRIHVPASYPFVEPGEDILVHTTLKVKEDRQDLYGFVSKGDRDFFETLNSVSGIGPKSALAILSTYGSSKVKEMILSADHVSLSKVKGLGQKGAKKIILELSGVLASENEEKKEKQPEILDELATALRSLGFTGIDVKNMVDKGRSVLKKITL